MICKNAGSNIIKIVDNFYAIYQGRVGRMTMPPRVLVAPDSFKGTLTAVEVAAALAEGLRRAGVEPDLCPVADGGEGTLDALGPPLALAPRELDVANPLGRPVRARFGLGDACAVVEVAEAIGLPRVAVRDRDPLRADSRGVGQLILAAFVAGAERVLVGVGGTATVDGGGGCLDALGADGRALLHRVEVLADVTTPFERAAAVFGPQKGARPEDVERLAARLSAQAAQLPRDPRGVPGSGAGGGLAGALWAHGAQIVRGAERVLDLVEFDARLVRASLVVTGEGCLDEQTGEGKLVGVVARRACAAGVAAYAVVGCSRLSAGAAGQLGLARVVEAGSTDALEHAGFDCGTSVTSDG
jgi:glycerate 2-kinase